MDRTDIKEIRYYIDRIDPQTGLSGVMERYLRIKTALQGIEPMAMNGVEFSDLGDALYRHQEGIPLIKGIVLKVDPEKVKEGMIEISRAIGIGIEGDIEIDTDLSHLMEGLLEDRGENFPSNVSSFLLASALKPTLLKLKDLLSQHLETLSWSKGYCPFCGNLPSFALLTGEEGRRSLYCNLCDTQWNFKRLTCPRCGNEDQERMSYFYAEGEDAHRVDSCQRCMSYLKTLDARKMAIKGDLGFEDLITLPLDIVAQERGFHRMAANPLGMRRVLGGEDVLRC